MKENIVGLSIYENVITAACLNNKNNGNIEITNLGWIENRQKTSDQAIVSQIKNLWSKNNINTHTVCFSLDNSSVVLRYFKYHNLSQSEFESALYLEAEQTFQKLKKELHIDWYLYPQNSINEKKKDNSVKEGVLIAMASKDVKRYLNILKIAGLYPVVLDVSCMAISNLFLKSKYYSENETVCIVNICGKSADFAVLHGKDYIYPRSIYLHSASWIEKTDYLIENLIDFLKYYQFKLRKKPVEKLIFTGGILEDSQFTKKIQKYIELDSILWTPIKDLKSNLDITDKEIKEYGSFLTTSLGLALRGE